MPPSASSQRGRAPRQGRRTTHRRRLGVPRTGDAWIKDCYSGTSNHDDRGTGGAAASCRGRPDEVKTPARPRHYPPAPDTRTPQADGAPRYLPSQHDSDLPAELVTLIDLPCTPEVPDIYLLPGAGSIAAPARLPRPALAAPAGSSRRRATAATRVDPDARWSGGSAADDKVELDRQVGLTECVPGVGEGFGFDTLMQGVQVG